MNRTGFTLIELLVVIDNGLIPDGDYVAYLRDTGASLSQTLRTASRQVRSIICDTATTQLRCGQPTVR